MSRIGLIEHVEKARPELKLLRLANVEVLEERNIKVAAARRPDVERWLRWSSIGERRKLELR